LDLVRQAAGEPLTASSDFASMDAPPFGGPGLKRTPAETISAQVPKARGVYSVVHYAVAKFRYVQWLWDWLLGLDNFSFEWDAGNSTKSLQKHGATCQEAEEVFTEREFVPLGEQYKPPSPEPRFAVLGKPAGDKLLFAAFTIRKQAIRVISDRPMNDKERKFYASLREE
jgi:uncharacterized protein